MRDHELWCQALLLPQGRLVCVKLMIRLLSSESVDHLADMRIQQDYAAIFDGRG